MVAYKAEGTPYLEERYASKESWQKDYDAAIAKTEKNVNAAKELKAYMSDEDWAKIDNFTSKDFEYITEVKKYNKEVVNIKDEALAAKQKKIEEQKKKEKENTISSTQKSTNTNYSGGSNINLRSAGVVNWGGYRFTWYSQKTLPGGGLNIPGRHVNGAGFVCDGNGYIVAATAMGRGTVGSSPWGAWKSYDTGVSGNTVDLYVDW